MGRITLPIELVKDDYTVVIVGSGYGAAIAASRLARAGQAVCVLERGREFQPGEYPDTEVRALEEMQADLPDQHLGSRTGLYEFHVNQDINVFKGCGLGGTSLVNANVSLRAEPRVFDDPHWPRELKADLGGLLEEGYRRAEDMLKPVPYPTEGFPALPKLAAHAASAKHLGAKFDRTPINVNFSVDGPNHVGVEQHPCECCGDCVTGCNYHAKNTLIMNYLPDARNHGAEIFTEVDVRWVERRGTRWLVHCEVLGVGREKFKAPDLTISADLVILGAGTLGSTEILLRSKARGLPLSDQVGEHFTGNGDVLGFAYNTDREINGVGWGHHRKGELPAVGPCITGIIDMREQPALDEGMVMEEGSPPGPIAGLLPGAFAVAAGLVGREVKPGLVETLREEKRKLASWWEGPYRGAVHNTQTYLVMTHDNGAGRMVLENDRLRIHWPGVGDQPIFRKVNERLQGAAQALGGTFVENPTWSKLFHRSLVTVHPLGGCVMAEDATGGVVNHKGQVFSSIQGNSVYENFYVCDGAIIPRPLGVNPLLTISALAERCAALIAKDHKWQIDYTLPSKPAALPAVPKVGIEFTETMRGYFSKKVTDDYQRGYDQGKRDNSPFQFTLTIGSEDLADMIDNPAHSARMVGTAVAPVLSPRPLTIVGGLFNLFVVNPNEANTRNMRYSMQLTSEEGRVWYFEGFKVIREGVLSDVWHDTTTLYITLYDGSDAQAPVLGKGILIIVPQDFARQLTTMQVKNAPNLAARLAAQVRFGRFFAGTLLETYGGVFARENVFNPGAPPRQKRALRVTAPEVYFFKTSDGVQLRLTRYQGGAKGPIILSHGLGVSSSIFSIDTVETNLLEYLFVHGYDCWLLDYRASIELPSSRSQFTSDDIATKDYPAAVSKVREVTRAPSVQIIAHCYGSTTFSMAMMAGLEGVRAAVCSQIATHIVPPTLNKIRTGLHLPEFMGLLGIESLNAYVDSHADWGNRLYDRALELYPVGEFCNSPVCRRITFMYAPLYRHEQLNPATHDALHEMFGIANIRAFEGLALMTRKGHVVAADGSEEYLPHLDRLAIPITFIHGELNECFLPESTAITYDLLGQKNGKGLYTRHVIPGYGHIDCIYGKDASKDVYPHILEHLESSAKE
ncbi:MAG: GMC family oxidoreductase N-terminal domain-containing protein [Acidobacteriia bacterium]|nr:GMC family oxidoreductase N-terminal domain-containing protein [Terriglobia bacterium]